MSAFRENAQRNCREQTVSPDKKVGHDSVERLIPAVAPLQA
jgi:hypothetical protein